MYNEIDVILVNDFLFNNGDINVKVESCNESREYIMGKYGCGEMNVNGERKFFFIKIFIRKFEFYVKKGLKLVWLYYYYFLMEIFNWKFCVSFGYDYYLFFVKVRLNMMKLK